ncbi:MAG: hypothetical protein LBK67_11960 [Coriobacteriales bacterium]|nr:hypothetical protein [Coriobacteriales bacterium]
MLLAVLLCLLVSLVAGETVAINLGHILMPPSSAPQPLLIITGNLLMIIYALIVYPSYFTDKPIFKSSKVISFANFTFGPVVFGALWNNNLTKKKKGISYIVSAIGSGLNVVPFLLGMIIAVVTLFGSLSATTTDTSQSYGAGTSGIERSAGTSVTVPLPELKSDWQRATIPNVGTIDIPPTMEVQSGDYKEYVETARGELGVDSSGLQIVIQQKGLNEFDTNSTYARIMVSEEVGRQGDYDSLTFNMKDYSQADINELDVYLKSEIEAQSDSSGYAHLEEWFPLKLETTNGMSCIHVSYTRFVQDNPLVMVDTYWFQDDYRMIALTVSYRIEDEQLWKTDLDYSLSTFRISG